MVTAKWCDENLNSGRIRFKNVVSELKELFEAKDLEEIKEEFGDVLYFTYCWMYSKFGINLPMLGAMGSVDKFNTRLIIWRQIFEMNGLKFDTKYLVNGSNYEKEHKIIDAIMMAKIDQNS